MGSKSAILIIGSTGYAGRFLVEASVKHKHPTYAFVRESAYNNPDKKKLIEKYVELGVNIQAGNLHDHESLVTAIKLVTVVISALGDRQILEQNKIIKAIEEAGNVKRFFPSEFATDSNYVNDPVELAKPIFANKTTIRAAIEQTDITYTYVVANCFFARFLHNLCQPTGSTPPRKEVITFGDGSQQAIFVDENDFALCTIKAVEDPRTENKVLYINPYVNTISFNDLVSLWEKKIAIDLKRTPWTDAVYLEKIKEYSSADPTIAMQLAIRYSIFVSGDQTNFDIVGVEAPNLYPDVQFTTVSHYLDKFV